LFQMASGKAVHISEDALKKARTCLGEDFDAPPAVASDAMAVAAEVEAPPSNGDWESRPSIDRLYPIFDLNSGVDKRCGEKVFYAVGGEASREEILSSEALKALDKAVEDRCEFDMSADLEGLRSHVKRGMLSCVSLFGLSKETVISQETFLAEMRKGGFEKCTIEWVANHCDMITLKLLKYELEFPFLFKYRLLCAEAVYTMLCARYVKEFIRKRWSCLHKILMLEKHCSQTMVLVVSKIIDAETIELSDGWYAIGAKLDKLLCEKVSLGKIHAGKKLRLAMGQLQNLQAPCHPLEVSKEVFLALQYNSVFPARQSEVLGFARRALPLVPLSQVQPIGGIVPSTAVLIEKQYPSIFMERFPDGTMTMRNQHSEHKAKELFFSKRERIEEDIREKMQREFSIDEDELDDPVKIEAMMQDYRRRVDESFREHGVLERNVTGLLRLRVSQVACKSKWNGSACISLWRPGEDLMDRLQPGMIFRVTHLMAKPMHSRSPLLQLDSTKSTCWAPMGNMYEQPASLSFEMSETLCSFTHSLCGQTKGYEFDFSGVTVKVQRHGEAQYSVFMVSSKDVSENGKENVSWMLRVVVECQCNGLGHLARVGDFQNLSFQNLSFDFADTRNRIVTANAGIQSIVTPAVKFCNKNTNKSASYASYVQRVKRLLGC